MPQKPHPPEPESGRTVGVALLAKAANLLREAGAQGMTREDLARAMGRSTRHVDRMIKLLAEQGATIEKERVNQDGVVRSLIVMTKGPDWGEGLSPEALAGLRVATLVLEQVGPEVWSNLFRTFEQFAGPRMSTRDRIVFQTLAKRVQVTGTVDDPGHLDPGVVAQVLQALGHGGGPRQMKVTYRPPGRPAWTRIVYPWRLTHDVFAGGAFLLVWEPEKRRAVHLRLNRIEATEVLGAEAVPPSDAPLEHAARFQIGGWFAPEEPYEVQVLVSGRNWVQALLESPPGLPEEAVLLEGDRLRVRFLATEPFAPARWILQFGPDAEVLGPEAVRDVVKARLQAAAAKYP